MLGVPNSSCGPPLTHSDDLPASDAHRISRRRFGEHAALAAVLSLSPARLLAALHHSHRQSHDTVELTPEQTQNVEAQFDNILRKYGGRLSQDQRQHLRRILIYNERMLASVRAFALQNGDPPASVLKIAVAAETLSPGMHRSTTQEGNT
jgi:hypothetical protein